MDRMKLIVLLAFFGVLPAGCGADPEPRDAAPTQPQQPAAPESTPADTATPGEAQDPRTAELEQLLREGQKIHAIKLYREIHGGGLREAKDAVDAMLARLSSSK